MFEYFMTFLVLLLTSILFYLLYERFTSQDKTSHSSLYVEALRELLDNRKEAAFSKLRQVVAEDSTNIDAYLRLGAILRTYDKVPQALQIHKDLTLRGGLSTDDKIAILRELYADYSALKNYDMAEAALKEITQLHPKDQWAQAELLELLKTQEKWDDAYNTAVMLLKIENDKSKKPLALYKFHMGMSLFDEREYHKARILFKEAIGFDPAYVEPYLAIGDSYTKEERFEDAVNFWFKLISAVPEKGHLVIDRLKKTLFDLGRFGEIDSLCEKILSHSPRNVEAEEILTSILDDNPGDIKAFVELLRIHLEKNDINKIERLTRFIEHKLSRNKAIRQSSPSAS